MMRSYAIVLTAFVLLSSPLLAAQEATDVPPADPLLQDINAALDRGVDTPDRPESVFAGRGSSSATGPLMQGIFALCVVLALCLLVYYAVRRWGKGVPILAGSHFAKILGRIYLDRGTALHFVRVGERVLVIGVNSNAISTLADLDAAAFDQSEAESAGDDTPFNPDAFLAELQEHSRDLKQAAGLPRAEEDEIAALRGDIQRLQRYLRDENREQAD